MGNHDVNNVILLKEPLYLVAVSVAGGATKVPTPQNLTFFVFFYLSIDYNPHLHCSSLTGMSAYLHNFFCLSIWFQFQVLALGFCIFRVQVHSFT